MQTSNAAGTANAAKLLLLGYLTLFLELALIRFLPSSVWNLGFFPNFVLISVFVGLGVGFVFHHLFTAERSAQAFIGAACLLCVLVFLVTQFRPRVPGIGRSGGQIGQELFFSATNDDSSAATLYVFPMLFPLIALIFAMIAQRTAKVFSEFRPLTAYTLDIGGSCLGIVSFMAISQFQLPAYIWFAALAPMFALSAPRLLSGTNILAVAALVGCSFLSWQQDQRLLYAEGEEHPPRPLAMAWSPYQKVETAVVNEGQMGKIPYLFVNGIVHQKMQTRQLLLHEFYHQPYERRRQLGLPPYKRVLILGAGTGNDVAAALLNGAEQIDAVEIDPVIARMGRNFHPLRPYASKRVRLVIDDGRAFLTRAQGPYDLIVFAVTDSLVKISPTAQLRLENYLFTLESITRAYGLLSPEGDLVFYNWYRQEWLVDKIKSMIHTATGHYPTAQFRIDNFSGLITPKNPPDDDMPLDKAQVAAPAEPEIAALAQWSEHPDTPPSETDLPPATDDWPFLYLRSRAIAPVYLGAIAGLLVVVTGLLVLLHRFERRQQSAPIGPAGVWLRLAFMLMGSAFLLLETKGVIQFSLLFGTTWLNNSLVFLAVLVSVLAANWTAMILRSRAWLPLLFVLLLASCLLTLVWPLAGLLQIEDWTSRFALASLMTYSPIFFANLVFSLAFRDQPAAEQLFGWNLLGATFGGALEYLSMILGCNALAVMVAVLYLGVFWALWRAGGPAPQTT
ncbi:MAG: hypothetical protein K1X74_04075 [Pirellulales bacterium]|nr:hypothetical protein [Pirellulales bacterium]